MNNNNNNNNNNSENIDVLFFPSQTNAKKFVNFLKNTKKSILLHIYSNPVSQYGEFMENEEISNILIDLSNKGVDIKIITDTVCFNTDDYKFKNLSTFCNVMYINNNTCVFDKYAIIDDEYFLSGSYDWTSRSFILSNQDLHIIKSSILVSKYAEYFINLWNTLNYKIVYKIEKPKEEVNTEITNVVEEIVNTEITKLPEESISDNKTNNVDDTENKIVEKTNNNENKIVEETNNTDNKQNQVKNINIKKKKN